MALILSIESSTNICSVCLSNNGNLLFDQTLLIEKSHSEKLVKMVENIFDITPYNKEDLSSISISLGPGSYTGLRIGLSTAKGLCMGLNIPIIGVNTLKSMAYCINKVNINKNLICPMIDARRDEVYCMILNHNLEEVEPLQAKIIEPESFKNIFKQNKVVFFGDGSNKVKKILRSENAIFIDEIYPAAEYIGKLSYQKYLKSELNDLDELEPIYLKSPVKNEE